MRVSVLIKVLEGMFYHCRNKTLQLTFYETLNPQPSRRPGSRKEFDSNLPDIYYIASVSAGTKMLYVMRKEQSDDRSKDHIISTDAQFNFDDLMKSGSSDYTVHEYCEVSPFTKNSTVPEETGIYKKYAECLKFDATLYVDLFKLMGETVSIMVESKGKLYLGHYIDGRVMMVDINDWSISVRVTDFYNLHQYLPEYEVVDFTPYPENLSKAKYLRKLQQSCEGGGLQFLKN